MSYKLLFFLIFSSKQLTAISSFILLILLVHTEKNIGELETGGARPNDSDSSTRVQSCIPVREYGNGRIIEGTLLQHQAQCCLNRSHPAPSTKKIVFY